MVHILFTTESKDTINGKFYATGPWCQQLEMVAAVGCGVRSGTHDWWKLCVVQFDFVVHGVTGIGRWGRWARRGRCSNWLTGLTYQVSRCCTIEGHVTQCTCMHGLSCLATVLGFITFWWQVIDSGIRLSKAIRNSTEPWWWTFVPILKLVAHWTVQCNQLWKGKKVICVQGPLWVLPNITCGSKT